MTRNETAVITGITGQTVLIWRSFKSEISTGVGTENTISRTCKTDG